MSGLASMMSSRRAKWVVVLVWIVALAAIAPLGSKLASKTNDETSSFLPSDVESTKVLEQIKHQFPGGETLDGLVVYQSTGGFSAQERSVIERDARRFADALPLKAPPEVPFQPGTGGLVSRDGHVAYTVLALPDDNDRAPDWGKRVHDITASGQAGMRVFLTGDLGFSVDAKEAFASIDTVLLAATALLVLLLLGSIYRSPVIALIPLVVVGVSYAIARGLVYLYASSGETVSSNVVSILVVLMFGVGTDYCLLLVARYREELRRTEDKHAAMAHAIHRAGTPILASGLTVALSMLVLVTAETGSTRTLGPVAAIGVASTMLAGLTLLPALLTIAGRRGFWPRRSTVADVGAAADGQHEGLWRRFGNRVLRRPGFALVSTVALFAASAVGVAAYQENSSTTNFFKTKVQSVEGFQVLQRSLPAGVLSPTTVLVERVGGPVRSADVDAAEQHLRGVDGVASVTASSQRSKDGHIARLDVVLSGDPSGPAALDLVPTMRHAVANLGPGVTAQVGGGTAIQYDYDRATARDLRLIVPLALAVIALILALLLRAIVAPLVLIASVVASFLGALGLSLFILRYVFGVPGVDNSLPTFAFIFLVALGTDYTIFLMSRVREEARTHGTREGMLRALAATGPVITSAGVILAGTFAMLMTLPVTFTFNIGFMVALGILLDTFVVRTIMVPAAIELLGDRAWWPSAARPRASKQAVSPRGARARRRPLRDP